MSKPTDRQGLFLFAHQDDEFGVYDEIARCTAEGRAICAFFTDGAAGGPPDKRNAESLRVLQKLGVRDADVHFVGEQHGIADGRLFDALPAVAASLERLLDATDDRTPVYVPAWEGGHHDHDGLHAVTATVLARRNQLQRARQFPLYNSYRLPGPLFRVLTPLAANGEVTSRRLPLVQRCKQLRLCLSYPTQLRTWIGLYPFVVLRMLWHGRQSLQPLHVERVASRPHEGPLYYEKRGFLRYEQLQQAIADWQGSTANA